MAALLRAYPSRLEPLGAKWNAVALPSHDELSGFLDAQIAILRGIVGELTPRAVLEELDGLPAGAAVNRMGGWAQLLFGGTEEACGKYFAAARDSSAEHPQHVDHEAAFAAAKFDEQRAASAGV
jgi:hypothetical protein